MKIVLAQQNYHIGNFDFNTWKIISAINEAKAQKADLIVFSEMNICGYPARDFLEFNDFIDKCYQSLNVIKEHTDNSIGVLIGAPARNTTKKGKTLFNAAFFLHDKQIKAEIHKTLIPTYDVFDEYRYFEPAFEWKVVEFKGKRLAVTVCEDIWNFGDNAMYRTCPMDHLILQSPDIIINLTASPFDYKHGEDRVKIIKANVEKYKLPMIYCNTVGGQTDIVFDGGSLVFDKNGHQCKMLPMFEEAIDSVELMDDGTIKDCSNTEAPPVFEPFDLSVFHPSMNISQIYQALIMGVRDYFAKMGFSKAIIGSSGGIDSAVALAIACDALGSENVLAVLMPSEFSTEHSVTDAEELSKRLNNPYYTLPIKNIFGSCLTTLDPLFKELPFNVAEENLQSRIRGNLLMSISNKFGYILLNTSNKSELATGYGTLYGDMAGGLSVLGDCYKLQVYELAKYINREKEIIPEAIISKPPSAELRPNQLDIDSLPDYNILDNILYQYIERRRGPKEIKAQGYEPALVDRILKLVNSNEYKRNQFCPIIRVSPKSFGVGRKVPIVGKYLS